MTAAMRAAVLVEPGRFDIRDVPRPEPGRGEALIKIARTGICGMDMHIFHGAYAADKLPIIPGHEFTGHVAGLGPGVGRLEEGQSVVVDMNIGCDHCYWCRRQETLNCLKMQQIGITVDGAFSDYVAVPAQLVFPAPESIAPEVLALTEPLDCVVRAAKKARVTFGQSVVVLGVGPIDNLHVQLMRTIGAAPIIAADISPLRVQMALDVGAEIGISNPATVKQAVREVTDGRGADLVIESVGNAGLYAKAGALMRKGGHLAACGLTGPGETLPLDILTMVLQEISIKDSVTGMRDDMHDALSLLTHGRIKTDPFTRASYPLEEIQDAFDSFAERPEDLKTQIVMVT